MEGVGRQRLVKEGGRANFGHDNVEMERRIYKQTFVDESIRGLPLGKNFIRHTNARLHAFFFQENFLF